MDIILDDLSPGVIAIFGVIYQEYWIPTYVYVW